MPCRTVAALLFLVASGLLHAQLSRQVVVAPDGTGQFRTVQQAIDSAPAGHVEIDIRPGEYREVLAVSADGVTLHGLGARPENVVLVYDNSAAASGGTSKSATLTVTGDDFHAYNLTVANDFEERHPRTEQGSQAVALLVSGDREVFRHVRLLGGQDTLYANSKTCHAPGETGRCRASRQYFADCFIAGHVDFIFGDAKAMFDRCELHGVAHSTVTITAQSRVRPEEDSGFVFRNCTVTAEPGVGKLWLGRPWRDYSTVVWLNTDFKAHIDPKGWLEWDGRLKTSTYAEYTSHGLAGDLGQRAAPSRQLTSAEAAMYLNGAWWGGTEDWDPSAAGTR